MGHTIREDSGLFWFNTSRGVYTSFPYHKNIDARHIDVGSVLRRDGIVARFGCPQDQGIYSFRIICDDSNYDFSCLRSRTRTQVRRGLEACRVQQVSFNDLEKQAHSLNAETLIRQGRKPPANLNEYWTRYYKEAARTTGAETWAAFVEDQMAAYLISFMIEDTANLLIVRSSTKFLDQFPNNALIFQFLYHRLRAGDIRQVSYGYESIQSDLGSLDQFKTGMGFQKIPTGQRIELSSWLKPFVNRYTTPVASRVLKKIAHGESGAKLMGILDWYRRQPVLAPGEPVENAPIDRAA
jgi:hypothetical protein